jgi:hypothetical protein
MYQEVNIESGIFSQIKKMLTLNAHSELRLQDFSSYKRERLSRFPINSFLRSKSKRKLQQTKRKGKDPAAKE